MIDRRTWLRLLDMRDFARDAMSFISGKTLAEIEADKMRLYALIRAAEVVGEAASQIDPAQRALLPTLPWRPAIDMRNALIHGYLHVINSVVYSTVRDDFPPLIAELDAILGTTP